MKYADVVGFPGYRVSTTGVVQSCWRFKGGGFAGRPTWYMSDVWLTLGFDPDKRGRKRVTLRRDGRSHKLLVSRVVLEAFVGPCPDGMEACHNNGDCTDNRKSNLRWDTHSNNLLDRRRHGTAVCGEMINTAKLTEAGVREIRRIGYPLKQHAEKYGISETMVSLIIRRKAWQHVT